MVFDIDVIKWTRIYFFGRNQFYFSMYSLLSSIQWFLNHPKYPSVSHSTSSFDSKRLPLSDLLRLIDPIIQHNMSMVSERGTHFLQSFLMHKCVCKILTTCSVEMDMILTISWTFTFGLFKTISWILLIISGVVISFGRPGLGMISLLVRPQRNSENHLWTIPYIVVFNQHTKFIFFHLCKKFGGWSLSGTVTCKQINVFGTNFDKSGLKDGTCHQR